MDAEYELLPRLRVLTLRFRVRRRLLATRRVSEGRVTIDFPSLTRRVSRIAQLQNLRVGLPRAGEHQS